VSKQATSNRPEAKVRWRANALSFPEDQETIVFSRGAVVDGCMEWCSCVNVNVFWMGGSGKAFYLT
jgi:hypothetical protein